MIWMSMVSEWVKVSLLVFIFCQGVKGDQRVQNNSTPMHKVQMTQRGYIQFLRWEIPVPEITEFTYCLWIKSTNLTFTNSIFSYSKNESERLIRSWISPGGQSVNLEIGNVDIFSLPTNIRENHWYHLCQSWDNRKGQFALWLNGRLELQGYSNEMMGHVIPAYGDIVLGQEYTDFNKGLDEGIEGSVLGFNLLLLSAFDSSAFLSWRANGYVDAYHYKRHSRDFPNLLKPVWSKRKGDRQTLGEYLIRTTYEQCQLNRGSPFIDANIMLISWTRTPVKVFGGAIVKNVGGACGHFA